MIKHVKDMYYKNLHYIKWRDDESQTYGIAIYRAFVNHAGIEDWQPIDNVPCDKKANLERVKEQLWMLYHDAPAKAIEVKNRQVDEYAYQDEWRNDGRDIGE